MDTVRRSLIEIYSKKQYGLIRTAKEMNTTVRKIRTLLKVYEIPTRTYREAMVGFKPRLGAVLSEETRKKISKAHMGKKLSKQHRERISKGLNGKGWFVDANGYMFVKVLGHPMANRRGFVKRAHLVAETKYGRHVKKRRQEVVHHIDGNKTNDDPDNLEIMDFTKHSSIEMKKRWKDGTMNGSMLNKNRR